MATRQAVPITKALPATLRPTPPLLSIPRHSILAPRAVPIYRHRALLPHRACRHGHSSTQAPRPIPPPTPFVPDVPTFLALIGRSLSEHASKIPSWEALFKLSGAELREAGVEPARARRYLLWWRDRFRAGFHGLGGDLRAVGADGRAEVRAVERALGDGRWALTNGGAEVRLAGVRVARSGIVQGPHWQPVAGSHGRVAVLQRRPGMWEERRGQKVKGGERKRRAAEKQLRQQAKREGKEVRDLRREKRKAEHEQQK